MASTTAMFTGLSGLTANARNLDVIGNNIANANTTAFKSNRMLFASQFARNLSLGSGPTDTIGGSNPAQIGLGITIAGTQRNFNSGSLSSSGDARDLAIDGDGFFLVNRGAQRFYTRAGGFRQDSANNLVNVTGERVQGYSVDANFNIVTGTVGELNIPVGQLRLAQATSEVRFTGNLNAAGVVGTSGARITFPALNDLAAVPATGATLLTAVDNPNVAGSQALFAVGEILEIAGAEKGGKQVATAQLPITATTTVTDYLNFMQQALGIQTGLGANPDGFTPGATIAAGVITIVGNVGSNNDLTISLNAQRHLNAAGTLIDNPFNPTKAAIANGESVRHTFVAYDSLGSEVRVDVSMALIARTGGNGTTWRYFVESADAAGIDVRVGTGTIDFDSQGRAVSPAPISIAIDRTGSGAASPLTFNLSLSSQNSLVSALADRSSTLAATFQDGIPIGVLNSYSVGSDGLITGAFSNGQTRSVGQVVLAKFSNPEGLVDVGSSLFSVGPNSGTPIIATPTQLGTGRIVGGALEQSNVDLAQEFINMILASTGYSASSRVITTTDQLIQQLLAIGR